MPPEFTKDEEFGITVNAIAGHIARLEKKGFLWRDNGTIVLLKRNEVKK